MLIFVDESGDLGFKLDRGSSKFFTIALVIFEDVTAAQACEAAITALRTRLRLSPRQEFHFTHDHHDRRLALLQAIRPCAFSCSAFTIRKAAIQVALPEFAAKSASYRWACGMALEPMVRELYNATVTIDGASERVFQQELRAYLRHHLNTEKQHGISRVRIERSSSNVLLQLVDYVAGITNRLLEGKGHAQTYAAYLQGKWRRRTEWP